MKTYEQLLNENRAWAEETFKKIDKKMSAVTLRSRDKIPDGVDENGFHIDRFKTQKDWWCNGFFGGLNWLLYHKTGNEEYRKTAERNEEIMEETVAEKYLDIHHDVGFMWHLLSGANYRLTGNKKSEMRNFYMATTLMGRFVLCENSTGFIRAWNSKPDSPIVNWSIVDCLMNIPLLYWASEQTKDDRYQRIAMAHADMALRDHLRPDGSVVHIVEHDRVTGECVKTHGGQGIAVGSSWSRGCAWALYGFALSYIHTNEVRYLDGAKQVANYFIANCCDDWLPRIDFRAPAEPVLYDATAGACAACGLIELAKRLPENEGGMYMNAAIHILRAMGDKFCDFDPANDHMLGYGSVRYPCDGDLKKAGVHISIIYGDFFYTEAILKLLGDDFLIW